MTPEFKQALEAAAREHIKKHRKPFKEYQGIDVDAGFKSGSAWTVDRIVAWLRSDEADRMSEDRGMGWHDAKDFADEISKRFRSGK